MLFLLRPDPLPPLPIVRLFLKGTINELQPMRTLSRKALSILLKIFKPNLPREPREYIDKTDYLYNIAQAQPLAVEEWRNAIFVDNSMQQHERTENLFLLIVVKTGQVGIVPFRQSIKRAFKQPLVPDLFVQILTWTLQLLASGEAIKQVSDEIANFMNEVHQKEKFFYYLTQDHYVRVRC